MKRPINKRNEAEGPEVFLCDTPFGPIALAGGTTNAPAPGKKPKEPDTKGEVEESLYGGFFPKEPKEYWNTFAGIEKRVHENEHDTFVRDYGFCEVKKVWRKQNRLVKFGYGGFLSIELTKGDNKQYECCARLGNWWKTEDMVTAHEPYNINEIRVSNRALDRYFFKCDYHQKYFSIEYVAEIHESARYIRVMKLLVDEVHFSRCRNCGRFFELANTFLHIEYGRNCIKCNAKIRNDGVILKHNSKDYPNDMPSFCRRLGHVVRGGKIFASMGPIDEPVDRKYGVEVETEISLNAAIKKNVNRFDIAKSVIDKLGRDFVIIKEDGTLLLNGHYGNASQIPGTDKPTGPEYAGFEIVSAAAGLDIHRQRWPLFEQAEHHKLLRSWDCETCGFHIHVSRSSLWSDLVIGRMLVFLNQKYNRKFIWKVAGRSEMAYAKYTDRRLCDAIHPERVVNSDAGDHRAQSRRVALNLSNINTVEIRIFRGTVQPRHILRNLEFYDSVIEFCAPCSRSLGEIYDFKNYVAFVDRNRKRWPLLAAWFGFHEIIKLKKILRPEKVNRDMLTLKLDDIPEAEVVIK